MLRRLAPLTVLLTVALGAGLTGCSDDAPEATDATTPATTPAASAPSESTPGAPTADAMIAEVSSVAPALESFYRGNPYPETVEDATASLDPAGLVLATGTTVGGYVYDPDAVEFTLCLQDAGGAWASYDTAPMGVRDSGTSGGCSQG